MFGVVEGEALGDVGYAGIPRQLIVPVASSWDADRVLPAAGWLAVQSRAPVLLVSAIGHTTATDEHRAELERVADELRERGLVVDTLVRQTVEAGALITRVARHSSGSLVCMPTHGPGRLAEFALGTVTQEVVDDAPGHVLLVGPHAEPFLPPTRLVAAVDDSDASRPVIPLTVAWARAFGLDVELVESIDPHLADELASGPLHGDVVESATVRGLATDIGRHGLAPSWDVLHGPIPAGAIVDHVRGGPPSILVLGTHARHGIPRLVRGSVAMQVVHRSPVPVLITR